MISLDLDGMNPMQLAAAQGLRFMMQYVMKVDLTSILWVWGPVTQYQIRLDGIDSAGDGAADVMEIITRRDASIDTKSIILDDFIGGFVFQLYRQKWSKFGWYLHWMLRTLDIVLTSVVVFLCIQLKSNAFGAGGERLQAGACVLLVVLLALLISEEFFMGYLYALNYKEGVPRLELARRAWVWMKSFTLLANLRSAGFLLLAIAVYLLDVPILGQHDASNGGDAPVEAARRLLDDEYTVARFSQRTDA